MKGNILLAPAVGKVLLAYANRPHGSLLLSGPAESDLSGIANYLLELIHGPADRHIGKVYRIERETIEAVRLLLAQLALTRFESDKPRIIVIEDCERLSRPAQNALLKGLEEPPAGSHFLLTSSKIWEVLPTIVSRCQTVNLRPPLKEDLFASWPDTDRNTLEQAYLATDGWPQLMEDYMEDPESQLRLEIQTAKEFLVGDSNQRLRQLFGRSAPEGKQELAVFLNTLLSGLWRVSRAALLAAAYRGEEAKAAAWRRQFLTVNRLKSDFEAGLSHKLILLQLSLDF